MLSLRLLLLEPRSSGGSLTYPSILGNMGLTDSPCEKKIAPSAPRAPFRNPVPMYCLCSGFSGISSFASPYMKNRNMGSLWGPTYCLYELLLGWGMGQNLVYRARGPLLQGQCCILLRVPTIHTQDACTPRRLQHSRQ